VKRFLFLSYGFEKPTPQIMDAWKEWFASISDRTVDQGGLWNGGCEITASGTKELPFGKDSMTGYLIFNADSLDEAVQIVQQCPIVASNQVYEIMAK
jgi:hypothetical protein